MTNIGAIKIREDSGIESLVFVADSMASGNNTKMDDRQKLFQIGPYLLAGTGNGSIIENMAERLTSIHISQQRFGSAREMADAILGISGTFGLTEQDYLNFIVGGHESGRMEIFHVNTTGNTIPWNGQADFHKRGYDSRQMVFDGSGSRHVNDYLTWTTKAGIPIISNDVADAMLNVYMFGSAGATDPGVNTAMQFGIITPEGVSTSYPQATQTQSNFFAFQYLKEMLGLPFELTLDKLNQPLDHETAMHTGYAFRILGAFYNELTGLLYIHQHSRTASIGTAEAYYQGIVDEATIKMAQESRKNTKAAVSTAVRAMTTRGIAPISEFLESQQRERTEMADRLKQKYLS